MTANTAAKPNTTDAVGKGVTAVKFGNALPLA